MGKLKKGLKVFALVLLALSAVVMMVWLGLEGWSRHMMAKAEAYWASNLISFPEIEKKYPKAENNGSAVRLDELTKAFGCSLFGPQDAGSRSFWEAASESGQYVHDQLVKGLPITPPPERVKQFLAENANSIQATRDQLIATEPPIWQSDISKGYLPPASLSHLQRLLYASALQALVNGNTQEADLWLEASWRLAMSLKGNGFLVSRILQVSMVRDLAEVLRLLPDKGQKWRKRLVSFGPEANIREGLYVEACHFHDYSTFAPNDLIELRWPPLERPFAKSYARLSIADTLLRWGAFYKKIPMSAPCEKPLDSDMLANEFPRWNVLGRMATLRGTGLQTLGWMTALDIEITNRILDAWEALANGGTGAPEGNPLPCSVPCNACPSAKWIYESGPDGGLVIRCDHDFKNLAGSTWARPLRFAFPPCQPR